MSDAYRPPLQIVDDLRNIIEVDEGRSRVLTLNDTRHLGADA